MIMPGILVYSNFLTSVCTFIVSKALLISSATVIVRREGAIWLNPFDTVLFTVYSAITVACCILYPCCVCVCFYVRMNALLHCLQLLRGGIWACMRCPYLCVCCVCDPRMHLSVISIGFVYIFVRQKLSPHLIV